MKVVLFTLAVFAAVANAQFGRSRLLDGLIVGVIEDFTEDLKTRGLDPLKRDKESYEYTLPVTDLLIVQASAEDILVEGISELIINDINLSLITTRLQIDFTFPKLSAKLGSGQANVSLGGNEYSGEAGGSLDIEELRLTANIRLGISLAGLSIRDLAITLRIGHIESDLNKVVFLNRDLTNDINNLLNNLVPNFLLEFGDDVNEILSYFLVGPIEDRLPALPF